mgnify:CR=1 FL=1
MFVARSSISLILTLWFGKVNFAMNKLNYYRVGLLTKETEGAGFEVFFKLAKGFNL